MHAFDLKVHLFQVILLMFVMVTIMMIIVMMVTVIGDRLRARHGLPSTWPWLPSPRACLVRRPA